MAHRTLSASNRSELPVPLTSLVGRENEIATVITRLDQARLLTLIGPGGVGKTRLALTVAHAVTETFTDGVYWVPLAPIQDSRQVLPAIARALDRQSSGSHATGDLLPTILGHRHVLLVLDNVEHVSDVAPALSDLLEHCPNLHLLLTSRITLHLTGGHDIPVAPLPLPDTNTPARFDEIAANDAVTLFTARARSFRPDFTLNERNALAIAEICARVDGLPLAIEMAAARTRVLHPHGVLTRMGQRLPLLVDHTRDAPSRQRTLRDTIAWSYDLLGPDEQRLFRAISVFAGGCTLEAIASVGNVSPDDALGIASTLVDCNLLQTDGSHAGESRFRMLETIREYGLEQLEVEGESLATHLRHCDWCAAMTTRNWYEVDHQRVTQFNAELDNLRAAFAWSIQHGELHQTLLLCFSLAVHWFLLGALNADAIESLTAQIERSWPTSDFYQQVNALGDRLLTSDVTPDAASYDGLAIGGVSWIAEVRRDFPRAMRLANQMLDWQCAAGLDIWYGMTHTYIAIIATDMGEHQLAVDHLRQALPLLREVGDTIWSPHALSFMGFNLYHLGDLDAASEYLRASWSRFENQQQGWAAAGPLTYLARIARDRNDLSRALSFHQQALALRHRYGDRFASASTLRSIGDILIRNGQLKLATSIYAAAASVGGTRQIVSPHARDRFERAIQTLEQTLGPRAFNDAWSAGAALTFDAAIEEAGRVELTSRATEEEGPSAVLTPRESEILQLLALGLSQADIAERLFISLRTVTTHAAHIYGKLGVNTQAAAIAYAYQHGLVTPDDPTD